MRSHETAAAQDAANRNPNVEDLPWIVEGLTAGLLGAGTIAVFLGIVDLALGRPLFTPFALGSVLFLGVLPSPQAPPELVLAAAYTGLHAVFFAAIGYLVAFEVFAGTRVPGATPWRRDLVLAIALFVVFEMTFLGFALLVDRGLIRALGPGWVTAANGLAAAAMAHYLRGGGERYAREAADEAELRRRS